MKHFLTFLCLAFLHSPISHAVVTINVTESGGNVVATANGSLDLSNLLGPANYTAINGFLDDTLGSDTIYLGSGAGGRDMYTIDTTVTFLTGLSTHFSTSSSGDLIGFISADSVDRLNVPTGYNSGDPISSTSTWNSTTIPTLGLIPGTYNITWGSDSIILNIGSSSDTTAPTLLISSPQNNETGVAVDTNIVLTFDEAVVAGTGSVQIYTFDGNLVEDIPASDAGRVSGLGTPIITINPTSDLANSTDYYIEIEISAFKDTSDNGYFGIANNSTLNFTTAAAVVVTTGDCPALDTVVSRAAFEWAANVATIGTDQFGFGLPMWMSMVDVNGTVCQVYTNDSSYENTGTTSGNNAWLGSRIISAQKATTANAFSLDGLAISTGALSVAVYPGGSLYGLQHSNPVNTGAAYGSIGDGSTLGTASDPLIGTQVGGVNVFGGGVALYNGDGDKVGAIGASGDTSCRDHTVAYTMRKTLGLDNGPNDDGLELVDPPVALFQQPSCGVNDPTGVARDAAGDYGIR